MAETKEFVILTEEASPWHADHYYATNKEVPGADNLTMTGKYYAKVYEGDYKDAKQWHEDLIDVVASNDDELKRLFFCYTTCPNCAKVYGKNYVVGFAEVS